MKCRDINGTLLNITAGAADTEFAVAHEMAAIPRGAFTILIASAAILYNGVTPWTKDFAYLKSSVASAQFQVMFFT
jgi:hypothetical protein